MSLALTFLSSLCYRCKVLVVGGGAGGCSVAWRLHRKLGDKDIILIEPSTVHYYQPLFTLIGAGIKAFPQSQRPFKSLVPPRVMWLKDQVDEFDPCNNIVHTQCGYRVRYEVMVIGVGLKNDYDKHCTKCWCCIQQFDGGHAVFTFPKEVGKCSGAAQKIMYLAHDYWSQRKVHPRTNITYVTPKDALFGIPKYARALNKIALNRNIAVNHHLELVEVKSRAAVFRGSNGQTVTLPYNFLHVTPPMSPPACLTKCSELIDDGYLDVHKYTLQHKCYPNVYGIGDCLNTPNSKTAAAVAQQSGIVAQNVWNTMYGRPPTAKYDGYGACPILTSYKAGIIAEFKYGGTVCETLPVDQVVNVL
ncbi:sulfide:quinone oxidoreductase, mitochondrial-like [Zerene cesonia]|uniref:sulfide:quinone oxidoreductase, mitochondrial-like n=1 Tax=Zerene cesonia TaxID=33412 RepID=UPI0018E52E8E|nr:sulfide:quinone oxidoreductase, mitochondrial-like [Zerene cesonia]